MSAELVRRTDMLTTLPVPSLVEEQLDLITPETLHTTCIGPFDAKAALLEIKKHVNEGVLVVDIGGKAMKVAIVRFDREGRPVINGAGNFATVPCENGGANYLTALLNALRIYDCQRVGVSVAGVVKDGELERSPNLQAFDEAVRQVGGVESLVGTRQHSVHNDAATGVMAATVGALARRPDVGNVIYVINGGGLGGAVFKEGNVWAMEPGHIMAMPELNPFDVTRPCGMFNNTYTCLEAVAASGAGIENTWFALTGKRLEGRDIAELMCEGNENARMLYNNSALAMAHVINGIGRAMNLGNQDTTVVLHGGAFMTAGLPERIKQILDKATMESGVDMDVVTARELNLGNACLAGAGIAALIA
jgi:predicted NBD/HSP70 family sugar kinase